VAPFLSAPLFLGVEGKEAIRNPTSRKISLSFLFGAVVALGLQVLARKHLIPLLFTSD